MKNHERYSGIGWMTFYIKWRFPICFIVGIFVGISDISALFSYKDVVAPEIYYPCLATALLAAFVYFFRIPVYMEMEKMTPKGYKLNMILLAVETFQIVINRALNLSLIHISEPTRPY